MLLTYMRRGHYAHGSKALSFIQCSGCGCRERVEVPTHTKKKNREQLAKLTKDEIEMKISCHKSNP